MKVTIVLENSIIIGILQDTAQVRLCNWTGCCRHFQEGNCQVPYGGDPFIVQPNCYEPLSSETQPTPPEAHPALARTTQAQQMTSGGHIVATTEPQCRVDCCCETHPCEHCEPAALLTSLPPCVAGDTIQMVLEVTSVMERNGKFS